MSKEDSMVNALINKVQENKSPWIDQVKVLPESHYNHYGNRGVADLFTREIEPHRGREIYNDSVYEIKSPAAIAQSTGANQILRQFNKMRKYFYEDSSIDIPDFAEFELCFVATPETVEHVLDNYKMYLGAIDEKLSPHTNSVRNERVVFRHPDDTDVVPVGSIDEDGNRDADSFLSLAERAWDDRKAGQVIADWSSNQK